MNIGDKLTGPQLSALPARSVVVCDETDEDCGHNVIVRTVRGFDWYSNLGGHGSVRAHGPKILSPGPWTVVYLPPAQALRVGDMIETFAQSKTLPVGTVAVDIDEKRAASAPVIKAADGVWLFWDVRRSGPETSTRVLGHKIVHLPSADTGAGSTAA